MDMFPADRPPNRGSNDEPKPFSLVRLLRYLRRRPPPTVPSRPVVSVIDIRGRVGAELGQVSLESLSPSIDQAFMPRPDAVLLRINCGGGAPAQAEMIHRRIRIIAELVKVPVIASIEDMATSAGFWIALSADHIIAQESSLVGSVGTASYQFGFEKLLARLGIDRRVLATGPDKVGSDPFVPQGERARELAMAIQRDIHATFQRVVATRRGTRLKTSVEDVSLGTTWSGRRALELGLIDEIQDVRAFLAQRFRAIPEMRTHSPPQPTAAEMRMPPLARLARMAQNLLNRELNQSLTAAIDID